MKEDAARDWGIWYAGTAYTVGHFLKMLGPESKMMRFPTRQAAQLTIADRWAVTCYTPRMIPKEKPLPEKS